MEATFQRIPINQLLHRDIDTVQSTLKSHDEVLGYQLVRKLGSGGYGEVWEADAPGGLKKAIKFVYGYHDEKRAQAELKSLDRIKQARHPFLLSLERIEIFQSQLIIVSELADCSLADIFDDRIREGLSGIPREELLEYMSNSAGALDYLSEKFSLQHLDVKPENLLIVSEHAKVADFGLVKSIQDAKHSLMSGMTPAYAAPELFDGQPGEKSDQYSLAIVYQEMLTSMRPFPGSTPAQLAAQHMHGKPNLKPLPVSDQSVIARALSKDPADRFGSCKQMIEELRNRKSRKKVVKGRMNVQREDGSKTVVLEDDSKTAHGATAVLSHGLQFATVDLQKELPPELDSVESAFQPTIIIGVGQSGGQVLQSIKQRLVTRYDSTNHLPSIEMLCIDTDRESLAKMSLSRDSDKMSTSETLMIPLRKSEKYRSQEKLDLSWISRRWIYNVPKSLQTEGLRPLGRLAFADHFDSICTRISEKVASVIKAENIASTVEAIGLNPPKNVKPRVFIVTSGNGGLGSGMTLDLAYTVRLMLAENGVVDSNLIGIIMHNCDGVREKGLMNANMFAFLTELRHYTDHGYPGDPRLGIPEFNEDLPFDHSYFVSNSDKRDSNNKKRFNTDSIAEYICLNSTSKCSDFFEACRKIDEDSEELYLRTFGLSISGPTNQMNSREAVSKLGKHLTNKWVSSEPSEGFSVADFAAAQLAKNNLDLVAVSKNLATQITKLDSFITTETSCQQAMEAAEEGLSLDIPETQTVERFYDGIFELPAYRRSDNPNGTVLGYQSEAIISRDAQHVGSSISVEIQQLLQRDEVSFPLLFSAIEATKAALVTSRENVEKALGKLAKQLEELKYAFVNGQTQTHPESIPMASFVESYGQLRCQEFVLRGCKAYYRCVFGSLGSINELVKKFVLQVQLIGSEFQDTELKDDHLQLPEYGATIEELLIKSAESDYEQLVRQTEIIVIDQLREERGGFLEIMSDPICWQNLLPNAVRDAAQMVLSNAFKKISIDRVIADCKLEKPMVVSYLGEQLSRAEPTISECGGAARLLVGLPLLAEESNLPRFIDEEFDLKLCSINGTAGDLVVCFETDKILLANFAFSILKSSPEVTDLANRIMTRNDIDWTTLKDLI